MKEFIKKYWLVLLVAAIINIPILVLCCTRTDKTVTLKGDTTIIEKFVEIDREYVEEGSFSSIYVISFDHSTIFQNMLLEDSQINAVNEINEAYLHLNSKELNEMSKIQHDSSINYALICAYREAKKVNPDIIFEYEFECYKIAYYASDSEFRIGDMIVGVNDIYAKDDFIRFKDLFNESVSSKDGQSEFIVMRDGLSRRIKNTANNLKISGYSFYDIKDGTNPSFKIKETNVGGPSGGLLQTLSIYNSLVKEDITNGLKIVGTGTIDENGNIGSIGGVKYKLKSAVKEKADLFIVPNDENYEEAIKLKKENNYNIKIIGVSTFEETLKYLKNLKNK